MKVLILAENLEVNRTSSGLRSNKQILLYKRYFDDVEVLTTTPLDHFKQIEGVKYNFLETKNIKKNALDKIPKVRAIPTYLYGFSLKNKSIIKLWSNHTEELLKNNIKDLVVVLATGTSHLVSFSMLDISTKLYGKYIQFIHDPFPVSCYPNPYKIKINGIENILQKKFQKVLDKADILSYPSLDLKIWMQKFYGEHLDSKSIIQHHIGLHKSELEPILTNTTSNTIILKKGLNITHTGTLIGHREPRYLFKAFEKLLETYPEAKKEVFINVIGKVTNYWSELKVSSRNIIVFKDRVSYAESLDIQQKSDVLFTIEPVAEISPIMHGKMADYFTFDKPVLALTSKKSENARLLGYDYALTIENGNTEKIYKALELIYQQFLNDDLKSLNVSQSIREQVSHETWYKRLFEILKK